MGRIPLRTCFDYFNEKKNWQLAHYKSKVNETQGITYIATIIRKFKIAIELALQNSSISNISKISASVEAAAAKFIMAHTWREDQIAIFHEAFNIVDMDSDGFITVDELESIIQSLEGNTTKQEIREMMSEVDNGNGSVNFEVFLNIMGTTMKENMTEELKDAFKVFDRDNDGYISATELRQVMMKLGERLTEEEVEQMIRVADMDGDGRVSYEEFAKLMIC